MKNPSLLNSIAAFSLVVSMSLFLFTGCQSKSSESNSKQASAKSSSVDGNQSTKGRPNADEMKKRMEDNINTLVADGTINQSQGDKILEALTANTQRFNGDKKPQDNKQNNQQNTPQNDNNNNNGSGNNTQYSRQNGNTGRNNALSKLVSDGVITQAQADAVMQKIRGNFNGQ